MFYLRHYIPANSGGQDQRKERQIPKFHDSIVIKCRQDEQRKGEHVAQNEEKDDLGMGFYLSPYPILKSLREDETGRE